MASKRRIRRRQCTNKVRHDNEASAAAHAHHLRCTKRLFYVAYHCRWCHGWHVGRPDAAKQRMIRKAKEGDS